MALVSVLLVTVVLLGLAGAFFAAHKSDLALMTSGTYREQTRNGCLSVADYIQFKLQNDRRFGAAPFSGPGALPPDVFPDSGPAMLTAEFRSESSGGGASAIHRNYVTGTLPESGVEFEAEILNNLDGLSTLGVATGRSTPPRTCRVWITSRRGNVTQHTDFILKRSPFTSSTITSGKDINVQLSGSGNGAWWLGARQPSGNNVRASGVINGPEVWNPGHASVLFTPPPGLETKAAPPYGVLSGSELVMQVDGVPTNLSQGDEALKEAQKNIKGVLSPGNGTVTVPELNRDDLQGPARKVNLPKTELVFRTELGPSGETIHILEGDGSVLKSYNPSTMPPDERWFVWEGTDAHGAVVMDLETRLMAVADNVEVQAGDRPFVLKSVTADGQLDSARQPTLYLGSPDKGAAVDARSVRIEGSVGGMGAVKSQTDLQIAAKSNLSTTPDYGIALHAERDIVLTKPGTNATDGLAVDWDAFATAYSAGSTKSLDNWARKSADERNDAAAVFKTRKLAESTSPEAFDPLWAALTAEFPADAAALEARDQWLEPGVKPTYGIPTDYVPPEPPEGGWPPGEEPPPPEEVMLDPGIPAGPGISMDKYIRLREYLRTVKAGQPDPTWLSSTDDAVNAQREADVTRLISNQLSNYQLQAGQISQEIGGQVVLRWKPLSSYFTGSNPYMASYTPDMLFRGLIYAGRDFIFDTERKGIYIEGALVAKGNVNISDATGANFVYNSELLENLFATDDQDTSVPLERAYWAFY